MFGFDTPWPVENFPYKPEDSLALKTFLLTEDIWRKIKQLEAKIEELEKKTKQ